MSLLLVKDNANSKLRELECDSNGLLKVDKVDVSSLATESTTSALSAKVTACNTGAVVVASSALPSGASSETTLSAMNGKITACDTGSISGTVAVSAVSGNVACTHASLPLPSGASTESTLSAMNGKITACDTGSISGTVAVSAVSGTVACSHASLPLPSGASTEATLSSINGKITACDTSALATATAQSTGNTSLATLAGCVSANVLAVSAGTVTSTGVYVWGSSGSTASISGSSSANSTVVDCNNFSRVCIAGSTSNLSDTNVEIEVSINNSEFFELTSKFMSIDYNTGHFGIVLDAPFRYLRLKRSNTTLTSESIKAIIAGK